MKLFIATATALALFAGAASAAGFQTNDRLDRETMTMVAHQQAQLEASSIYTEKELRRLGLNAADVLNVTVFPDAGTADRQESRF